MKSPPPSFVGKGKRAKDSAYYSDRPEVAGVGTAAATEGSPSSHGTWSGMSPGISPGSGTEDAAERRRRRRAERQRNNQAGGVSFA